MTAPVKGMARSDARKQREAGRCRHLNRVTNAFIGNIFPPYNFVATFICLRCGNLDFIWKVSGELHVSH